MYWLQQWHGVKHCIPWQGRQLTARTHAVIQTNTRDREGPQTAIRGGGQLWINCQLSFENFTTLIYGLLVYVCDNNELLKRTESVDYKHFKILLGDWLIIYGHLISKFMCCLKKNMFQVFIWEILMYTNSKYEYHHPANKPPIKYQQIWMYSIHNHFLM